MDVNARQLAVILPMVAILTVCAVIEPGERGVRVSMGTLDRNLLSSGMQVYNPFTDQIIRYSVRQETIGVKAVPFTSDQQPITLEYKVLCSIPEDEVSTLYEKYSGDPFAKLVDPQIQEAFRRVVSQYKKVDQATKNVNTIKNQVLAKVRDNVRGKRHAAVAQNYLGRIRRSAIRQ